MAADSQVETFAALRLEIDSWRWKEVPVYIRAGKCLPVTCTKVIVRLRQPPTMYQGFDLKSNHVRFCISPDIAIAFGANVMGPERRRTAHPSRLSRAVTPAPMRGTPTDGYWAMPLTEMPPYLPGRTMSKRHGGSSIRC